MTDLDRAAASECVRLMCLLAESDTPHSKELAVIVASRLLTIVDEGAGEPLTDEDMEPMIHIGRQLDANG